MMKKVIFFGFLIFFISSCTTQIKANLKFNDTISIKGIIKNYKKLKGRKVTLIVKIGGSCYNIKRKGGVCLTDSTASIAAYGKLPKSIINNNKKNGYEPQKIINGRIYIKGIVKYVRNRQYVLKADNVVGGFEKCRKIEFEPGIYKRICRIEGGDIVYIFVTTSHRIEY